MKKKVIEVVAMISIMAMFLGAGMMDSENMLIPMAITFSGALMSLIMGRLYFRNSR